MFATALATIPPFEVVFLGKNHVALLTHVVIFRLQLWLLKIISQIVIHIFCKSASFEAKNQR